MPEIVGENGCGRLSTKRMALIRNSNRCQCFLLHRSRCLSQKIKYMCAYKPKSWREKMQMPKEPRIVVTKKKMVGVEAGKKLLIPTPKLIESYIRKIPAGQFISVTQMREALAKKFKADATCPLTTGIFLRTVAESALEKQQEERNKKDMTPFWRVIEPDSTMASKLSCGPAFIAAARNKERKLQSPLASSKPHR